MIIDLVLEKDVLKGKLTSEEKQEAVSKISTTSLMDDFADVDFVIEV